ncbi:hypothetical protein H8356DRAFT_1341939 [Neocallimastix lanati (nom. inval.)]|nr:hypothetical protein H8356DRAFT_1341939 [Neocallimastix sp. JGI-2020a]
MLKSPVKIVEFFENMFVFLIVSNSTCILCLLQPLKTPVWMWEQNRNGLHH